MPFSCNFFHIYQRYTNRDAPDQEPAPTPEQLTRLIQDITLNDPIPRPAIQELPCPQRNGVYPCCLCGLVFPQYLARSYHYRNAHCM